MSTRINRFPSYRQLDYMDCGPTCLRMVARFYERHYSLEALREKTFMGKQGTSLLNLSEAAEQLGFRTEAVSIDWNTLQKDVLLPCIAHWRNRHYVVIYRVTRKYVYVADPAVGRLCHTKEEFLAGWQNEQATSGILLLLEPMAAFQETETSAPPKKNPWSFLLPFFRPYYRYFWQLLLSVVAVSLIQLVFPFLAQSLVDQGIQQNNLHFIYIILIAQLALFTSQTVGEVIRSYLLWIVMLARRRAALEYKRFEASAEHQSQLHDLLYGMPEIRLNGSQQRRRWRWEAVRIKQHQVATQTL